jgi:adenylate cyclase class 2
MIEREVKYLVDDFKPFRKKLAGLGCEFGPSFFEDNIVFDDDRERLRREGKLLRLRKSDTVTITFKEPVDRIRFKIMEEHEIEVSNFEEAERIIISLGFRKAFRYQKRREVFISNDTHILLDETPIGNYIEIEGEEDRILELSEQLGLSPDRGTSKNYMELYEEYCAQKNLGIASMNMELCL